MEIYYYLLDENKYMKNDETIVFFSSVFPYETTLDKEIESMSKHFDKIYYIPVTCTVTDFNSISCDTLICLKNK